MSKPWPFAPSDDEETYGTPWPFTPLRVAMTDEQLRLLERYGPEWGQAAGAVVLSEEGTEDQIVSLALASLSRLVSLTNLLRQASASGDTARIMELLVSLNGIAPRDPQTDNELPLPFAIAPPEAQLPPQPAPKQPGSG